ncbi:MAG TPA: hypothetical protein VN695_14420, partial [Streptosporangiaceae bacterium]|nr:hypothetical protein [Streptosporangiaceae bacterium]
TDPTAPTARTATHQHKQARQIGTTFLKFLALCPDDSTLLSSARAVEPGQRQSNRPKPLKPADVGLMLMDEAKTLNSRVAG